VPLDRVVDLAFAALASGVPENSELRNVSATATGNNVTGRKENH
jgi:hypothetical protein